MYGQTFRGKTSLLVRVWAIREAECGGWEILTTCTPMSVPTRSFKRNGPMGMPNCLIVLSMANGSQPKSTNKHADIVYGKNTRFTANPVQLPTTTGVFLMRLLKPRVSQSTWGGVFGVRMISNSCMMCAGEKKCAPTKRCGDFIPAAIFVMSIVDVFVDKIAPGGQTRSKSPKIFRFDSRF